LVHEIKHASYRLITRSDASTARLFAALRCSFHHEISRT
jgi:hypothetical protein